MTFINRQSYRPRDFFSLHVTRISCSYQKRHLEPTCNKEVPCVTGWEPVVKHSGLGFIFLFLVRPPHPPNTFLPILDRRHLKFI